MQAAQTVLSEAALREDGLDPFRALVDEYSHRLFRLAYHMTGNEQDAEDAVQETFVRVYRNLHKLRRDSNPSAWIHRITANCAVDQLRKRQRSRASDQVPLESQAEPSSGEPGPERASFGGELKAVIRRELERMTPRERTAFVLRHHEGMSIREIGRVLGSRENTTKNYVFRAVRKLRAALAPMVEQET